MSKERTIAAPQIKNKAANKKNNGCDHQNIQNNQKEKQRLLITVNVLGSAGPMRFVVKEDEQVASVIDTALRSYAREGRLPVMGTDATHFLLYCANAGSDALSPLAEIGSEGARTFMLCKKQKQMQMTDRKPSDLIAHKGIGCWKSWLNNPFTFKLISH